MSLDLAALADLVPDGLIVTDAQGLITWANEAALRLYRAAARDSIVGLRFNEMYRRAWDGAGSSGEGAAALGVDQGLRTLAAHRDFVDAPCEIPLPNLRWSRIVERTAQAGLPAGQRLFVHVDITDARRQQQLLALAERRARDGEKQLRTQTARLDAMLEHMEQGVLMVDADRVVQVCNRRAIELLGLPAELMGRKPHLAEVLAWQSSNDGLTHSAEDVQEFLKPGGPVDQPRSHERKRPDGRVIEFRSVPIEGGGVLRTCTDITERRRSDERIRHLARHDGLTSLVTREVFLEHVAGALQLLKRSDDRIAVHLLDLDGFKAINDQHGHVVGDKVLSQLAQRLRTVARESDVVARLGGDEFAVMQYRVDGDGVAQALAARLLAAVGLPLALPGVGELRVGVSIGIALARAGDNADQLIHHADAAMVTAKAAGRNNIRLHGGTPG